MKSDHKPLKFLYNKSDLNQRQARWIEDLLEFNIINFEHITGKANVVADALSRSIADNQTDMVTDRQTEEETEIERDNRVDKLVNTIVAAAVTRSESQQEDRNSQQHVEKKESARTGRQ